MRGIRYRILGAVVLSAGFLSQAGCQTSGNKRPATVVSPGPAVSDAGEAAGEKTIAAAPIRTTGFAARHPLFYKPKEYWESSGNRKIVKAAAATFIGVPAGLVGEVKQIIVGAPASAPY